MERPTSGSLVDPLRMCLPFFPGNTRGDCRDTGLGGSNPKAEFES